MKARRRAGYAIARRGLLPALFGAWLVCLIASAATGQPARVVYVYDDLGRLARVIDTGSGECAIYEYDAVGNILSISRRNDCATPPTIDGVTPGSYPNSFTLTGTNLLGATISSSIPGFFLLEVRSSDGSLTFRFSSDQQFCSLTATLTITTTFGSVDVPITAQGATPLPTEPIAGSIGTVGATESYCFALETAERVVLQATQASAVLPCIKVTSGNPPQPVPGGSVCASVDVFGTKSAGRLDLTLQAGTYLVQASAAGNQTTGGYNLLLERIRGQEAVTLVSDTAVSDTITPVGDLDLYTFTLATAQRVVLQATQTSNVLPCMELYSGAPAQPVSNGTACASVDVFGTHFPGRLDLTLSAGTYLVLLRDSGNVNIGTYSLLLQQALAAVTLVPDVMVSDTISPTGDVDLYSFTLEAPERIVLQTTQTSAALPCIAVTTGIPPQAVAGGSVCASVDVFGTKFSGRLDLTLQAGTYVVQVSAAGNLTTGSYNLLLERIRGQEAVTLVSDTAVSDTITPVGDLDLYTFTLGTAQRVVLQATQTSNVLPCMELYSGAPAQPVSNGTACATVDVFGTQFPGRLDLALSAGKYVLLLRDIGNINTGTYGLLLQQPPEAVPLVPDVMVSDTISPAGDVDLYSFTLDTVERVVLQTTQTSAVLPCIAVTSGSPPQGVTGGSVCASVDVFGTKFAGRLDLTLQAGTYFVQVSATGNLTTGSYNLLLERIRGQEAVALVSDTAVSDTIMPVGDLDLYTFTLATAQRVVLQAAQTSNVLPCMELYSGAPAQPVSNGTACASVDVFGTHFPGRLDLTLSGGTYVLLLRDSGNVNTGTYGLLLQELTVESAVTLVPDVMVSDTISPTGDVDLYSFTLDTAERVVLQTTQTSGVLPCIGVTTGSPPQAVAGGAVCASVDVFGTKFAGRLDLTLQAGTYLVQASAAGNLTTGSYNLLLERIRGQEAVTLASDTAVSDTIMPVGDLDLYTFTLATAQRVVLQATQTSNVLPCMELYSGAPAQLVSNGTACASVDVFGTHFPGRLDLTLSAGTYVLLLRDSGNLNTGTYGLLLQQLPVESAVTLVPDVMVSDTISPAGDVDLYSFTLDTAERVVLQTTQTSGVLPCIGVTTGSPPQAVAGGSVCASVDVFGTKFAGRLNLTLQAGTYFVQMTAAGNLTTGSYNLLLERIRGQEAVTLVSDTAVSDTITPVGDQDLYTFTLGTTQQVVLQATQTSNVLPCMELYSGAPAQPVSNGTACASVDVFGTHFPGRLDLTLSAGTYVLLLRDSGNVNTGTYNLLLHQVP